MPAPGGAIRPSDAPGGVRHAASSLRGRLLIAGVALLVLTGSCLQGYANGTAEAPLVGMFFLASGCGVVAAAFRGRGPEVRAFMLAYGLGVLAGGLAQCYALVVFGEPQSFSDSVYFLQQVSPRPPFVALLEMPADVALAIAAWQGLYAAGWWLGLSFGTYTAVMFNALVMGISGSLTVATARALFGHDPWRLRRVGTLFAFCGLSLLFGALLLRDCFVVFFTTLWFWGVVRWLVRPCARTLVAAAILTAVSVCAMLFLRDEAVVLFGLFGGLAIACWYAARRLNAARLSVIALALAAVLAASPYIAGYAQAFLNAQTSGEDKYTSLSEQEDTGSSLGMRLIVHQSLPVRLVFGTGLLLVNPIPLSANFRAGALEYYWIRGYHGIYQVLVLPLGLAGLLAAGRMLLQERRKAFPWMFVALFLLLGVLAVVSSSGELRHLGQFMPAFMILAALPDTRQVRDRLRVRWIALPWYAAVMLAHAAWAVMKGVI